MTFPGLKLKSGVAHVKPKFKTRQQFENSTIKNVKTYGQVYAMKRYINVAITNHTRISVVTTMRLVPMRLYLLLLA